MKLIKSALAITLTFLTFTSSISGFALSDNKYVLITAIIADIVSVSIASIPAIPAIATLTLTLTLTITLTTKPLNH